MLSKVKFEQNSIVVSASSVVMIATLCAFEIMLGVGVYFLAVSVDGTAKYIFLCVSIFFFIALALGLLPLINSALSGNGQLMWGATVAGILVPATTTHLTTLKPPLLYQWSDIGKIIFVDELTEYSDNKAISWNRLLILFNKKGQSESLQEKLLEFVQEVNGSSGYKIVDYPKKYKAQIHQKLTALVPNTITIELLNKYQI